MTSDEVLQIEPPLDEKQVGNSNNVDAEMTVI